MAVADETGSKLKPLLGTDEATVDDKGRILFSKKKRDRLGEDFTIAIGPVGCLIAYPEARWLQIYNEIMERDSLNVGTQQFTRLTLGLADDEMNFDAQGRVVIPQKLRDLAKLKDKVLLVGCGDRVEIWAKSEWEEYSEYPDTYGQKRRESIEKAYAQMVSR